MIEPNGPVWYAKIGISKPLACTYIGPVEVDFGGYSNMHIVALGDNTLMLVNVKTLYAEKQKAIDALGEKKTNQIQELEMYTVNQLELEGLRGD